MMLTIEVDEEDYPVPSDGDVREDFEEYVKELFYDVDGATIKHMRVLMETQRKNYLPTDYQNFIALSRYARWKEDEQRRETWIETVDRYFDYMEKHLMDNNS